MPKQTSLPDGMRGNVQRHGGQSVVAKKIGLKYQGQLVSELGKRRFWTYEQMSNLIDEVNIFFNQQINMMPSFNQVKEFLKVSKLPIVVKADGLAAGKGVTICSSSKKVLNIYKEIFNGKYKSSKKLVLEEFLIGKEVSYFIIVDKYNFKFFGTAQDHKKVKEKDQGPNTGGMGAYSPAPIVNKSIEKSRSQFFCYTILYFSY